MTKHELIELVRRIMEAPSTTNNPLLDLGFSEGLVRHLAKFDETSPLGFRCRPPLRYASSPISLAPIVPLWECGSVLTYYSELRARFEVCSLEDVGHPFASYRTAQAVVGGLFIGLFEDDLPEETLRSLACELHFSKIDLLLPGAQSHQGQEYTAWVSQFLRDCDE